MKRLSLLCGLAVASAGVVAAEATVNVSALDAQGASTPIGTVRLVETRYGLALYPNLRNLQPGVHGFHVHENPSCAANEADGKKVPGGAAGGHYDPEATKKHGEPWGTGHLGDLPPLVRAARRHRHQPGAGAAPEAGRRAQPFADGARRRRQPCRPPRAARWRRCARGLRRDRRVILPGGFTVQLYQPAYGKP